MEPHQYGAGLAKLWCKRKEPEPLSHAVKPPKKEFKGGSKYHLILHPWTPFSCVLTKEEVIKLVEDGKCVYCKHSSLKVHDTQWRGHGCTPSFTVDCSHCKKSYQHHTSSVWNTKTSPQGHKTLRIVPVLLLVGILLSGLTYHQVGWHQCVTHYRLVNCCTMWTWINWASKSSTKTSSQHWKRWWKICWKKSVEWEEARLPTLMMCGWW